MSWRLSQWDWPRILFARYTPSVLGFSALLSLWAIAVIYFDFSATGTVASILLAFSGRLGAVGIFALLIPMWFFWLRCDYSSKPVRTMWFFLLLFGMSFAAIPYYIFVYLPAVRRHMRGEQLPERPVSAINPVNPATIGPFGKMLLVGWAFLFLTVTANFIFPKPMASVLRAVSGFFVIWPVFLLLVTAAYAIALMLRIGLRRG